MSFRAIDVSALKPAAVRDQAAPVLDWVEIDRLVIDERYQRPLGPKNLQTIQAIADDFSWAKFSPVLVAPTSEGKLAVIDGQHRVHAAMLCGIARVPAQIVLLSMAEQAGAFAGVNQQRMAITAHQVFRAALAAGEGWAVGCRDVVADGYCLLATANPTGTARKARHIYAVQLIKGLVSLQGGSAAVRAGLRALVGYDVAHHHSGGRVALYSDYLLRPFLQALLRDSSLQRIDLVAFLQANDPFKLIARAEGLRARGEKLSNRDAFVIAMRGFAKAGVP